MALFGTVVQPKVHNDERSFFFSFYELPTEGQRSIVHELSQLRLR